MRTELVTTLKRQATEILNQLEKDREPILITQHGVPSAYLVDVETFETLQRRIGQCSSALHNRCNAVVEAWSAN
jgi:prevent-host-death family protein